MHCLIRDYQDFILMQNVEPTVYYFSCKKRPAKQNTWKLGPEFSGPLGQLMALGNPHWINDSQNINHELILELAFKCKKSSGLVLHYLPHGIWSRICHAALLWNHIIYKKESELKKSNSTYFSMGLSINVDIDRFLTFYFPYLVNNVSWLSIQYIFIFT